MHWLLPWTGTLLRLLITGYGLSDLILENLALRQQLAVLQRRNRRPFLLARHRAFWILLSRVWPRWREACILVKPGTILAWHRAGFRSFWRWRSRNSGGRPGIATEIRTLIRRMAVENPGWGAPRIHGELLKLGFDLSERTVSRFMPKRGPIGENLEQSRQTWRIFLRNHRDVLAAMDFLVVPTWNFRPLYTLVLLDHGHRIIRHFNVTAHPTAEWLRQQLREAFPFDTTIRVLIHDRDSIFTSLKPFLAAFGIEGKITAFRSPWQNGTVERMNGTLRSCLLDHVIALDENHLRRLITEFLRYYHHDRTHLGLGKDSPRGRPIETRPEGPAVIEGLPFCGGLHHRCAWRKVA